MMWSKIKDGCRNGFNSLGDDEKQALYKDVEKSSADEWIRSQTSSWLIKQYNEMIVLGIEKRTNLNARQEAVTEKEFIRKAQNIFDMMEKYINQQELKHKNNRKIDIFEDTRQSNIIAVLTKFVNDNENRTKLKYMHNGQSQCSGISCFCMTALAYGRWPQIIDKKEEHKNVAGTHERMIKVWRWCLVQTLKSEFEDKHFIKLWDYLFKLQQLYYNEWSLRKAGAFGCSFALFVGDTTDIRHTIKGIYFILCVHNSIYLEILHIFCDFVIQNPKIRAESQNICV